MSNSRKRRTRRTHDVHRAPNAHQRARAQLARSPHLQQMLRADEAERRGDVVGTLELVEEMPEGPDGGTFWRPDRIDRLLQLAVLGPHLPRWARSRWLVEQSVQDLDERRQRPSRQAMEVAIEVRGGIDTVVHLPGEDPRLKVQDHDWVFRQLLTYDYGGLASFLRRRAHPDIITAADRVEEWAGAPMGGFRFAGSDPATTTWVDLASGDEITTANIGSAALMLPGEHVIGRLVPIEGGRMFEGSPLFVPPTVAQGVADDPSAWLGAMRESRDAGTPVDPTMRFGFLSDVSRMISLVAVYDVHPADVTDVDLARRLVRATRGALDGDFSGKGPVDVWPCLAREVMSHDILAGLSELPEGEVELAELGDLLAEPAASVCRAVVEELRHVA